MIQQSTAVRNASLDASYGTGSVTAALGSSPKLKLFTGAVPANCAAADPAGPLITINLPATAFAAAGSGAIAKTGTWQGTASAGGTAASYRVYATDGTTCHEQGTAGQTVNLTTNALTAVNGNVLNFASTTGVVVGMNISGTGIPTGATVVAFTGTTVTMSHTSTAGVANSAAIAFKYDLELDNAVIANTQTVTIGTFQRTASNA